MTRTNSAAPDRPNILLILSDQHRWDCLGAYGNADVRTPNIDRLAADGVRHDGCFCPYPVCTPSRYSLLTGVYVRQHLGWTNHSTVSPAVEAFPRILRRAGYGTAAVGKMHFTPTYLDVGFQDMILAEQDGPGRFDDDYHRHLRARDLVDRIDLMDQRREYRRDAPQAYWDCFGATQSDLPEEHHSTTWIADRAAETLRQWPGGGQLLMVGFIKPHHPFDPPAPWSRMYDPRALTLRPGWREQVSPLDLDYHPGYFPNADLTEPRLRRIMAMYYATISQIDHQVGRLLRLLDEKGLYDDTMIIYTSDHGDYMGFRHLVLKGGYMYDPLVRVPLIIKYPGRRGGGTVSEGLVSNLELAPTILAAAGCEPAETMRGLNLAQHPEGRERVFAEDRRGAAYMVRSRTRKLLLCRRESQSQFFDLEADPLERTNLFGPADRREEIRRYVDHLLRWSLEDAVPPTYVDERAPTIRRQGAPLPPAGQPDELREYFRRGMASAAPDLFGT